MRPEGIYAKLHEEPFRPFRIRLSNGSTYEIRHPELVVVGRTTMFIGMPAQDLPSHFYDRSVTVSIFHIAEMEPLTPPAATSSN